MIFITRLKRSVTHLRETLEMQNNDKTAVLIAGVQSHNCISTSNMLYTFCIRQNLRLEMNVMRERYILLCKVTGVSTQQNYNTRSYQTLQFILRLLTEFFRSTSTWSGSTMVLTVPLMLLSISFTFSETI